MNQGDKPTFRLKMAMAELTAICEKYDLGGAVNLCTPEAGEFRLIFPKWSSAQISPDGKGIRVVVKKDDLNQLSQTGFLIFSLRNVGSHLASQMGGLYEQIKKVAEIHQLPFYNFDKQDSTAPNSSSENVAGTSDQREGEPTIA